MFAACTGKIRNGCDSQLSVIAVTLHACSLERERENTAATVLLATVYPNMVKCFSKLMTAEDTKTR